MPAVIEPPDTLEIRLSLGSQPVSLSRDNLTVISWNFQLDGKPLYHVFTK